MNNSISIILSFLSTALCCHTTEPFSNGQYEKTTNCDFINITEPLLLNTSEIKNVLLPCFEQTVGFYGNEINTDPNDKDYGNGVGKQESALECQQLCQLRDECNFFTYVVDDKSCWLLSSDSGRTQGSQYISGKKYCSDLPEEEIRTNVPILTCFDENVGYQESQKTINNDFNDVDYVYGDGKQNSALACQALCQIRSQCNFFTYIPENKACWLMSSNEHKFSHTKTSARWHQFSYISGKKFCDTPVGLKGTILPCLEQKVDFFGNDINIDPVDRDYGSGVGRQNNAVACQLLCQQRNECKFFTYIPDTKACWLKNSDIGRRQSPLHGTRHISGKKYCQTLNLRSRGGADIVLGRNEIPQEPWKACKSICMLNKKCRSFDYCVNNLETQNTTKTLTCFLNSDDIPKKPINPLSECYTSIKKKCQDIFGF